VGAVCAMICAPIGAMLLFDYGARWATRGSVLASLRRVAEQISARTELRITIQQHRLRYTATIVRPTPSGASVAIIDPLPAGDVKSWLLGIDAGWRLRPGSHPGPVTF
jgi:hypothetical protein